MHTLSSKCIYGDNLIALPFFMVHRLHNPEKLNVKNVIHFEEIIDEEVFEEIISEIVGEVN